MSNAANQASQKSVGNFASALIRAHMSNTRFFPDGPVPTCSKDAFAVQAAVMAELGDIGAFKVADKSGAPFVMAPIRADRIFQNGADVPIVDKAGIELEVGFEILSPIPPDADISTIAGCVWPRPVIEVVDTRIAGPLADDPFVKLADLQANSALVVGARARQWDGADFGEVEAQLTCGDTVVLDGMAVVPGGSALNMVAKLAERIGEHCGGLQPGQIVITGSLNGLPYFPARQDVRGNIEKLAEVAFHLSR
ncbi:hydratase [Jannaschia sp. CCS1]|uniref:hydratase n=1 Tax=Jannaschia sp. (strain CCS1) TaxID=290400 RepID=UPI000053CA9F|nr:hydratase [Jannaschia sp. CCS1]ABD54082.1 putative hydratase protein [Jannaschia sp. CCS1]